MTTMPETTDPSVINRYTRLVGERVDDGEYRLRGLPADADFRDPDEYDTLSTGWLKVEGVGFAAPSFEFSEHETAVVVKQDREGGPAFITFESL